MSQHTITSNRETVASYERIARDYAESTASPDGVGSAALRRLVVAVPPTGQILEIGSGPGWDADFVESFGPTVRRTDITRAFVELQRGRGKQAEVLDAIYDEYGGPYDAVLALCVLLHIERDDTDRVLAKVAAALRPGGSFLVSVREGVGEQWEVGESGSRYHVVFWDGDDFRARLAAAGLTTTWAARSLEDSDEPWLTVLATKTSDTTDENRNESGAE
ncbi:class I SAM-dependent DNA methyltransferase [Nocardioides speluncae]|uniref:class I SAM-dependent DNA methyltransferase n=1 Tax=Nocardioides speluncae TaxID=2670337 RepID=UPI000D69D637|nr:class I SAM-dependent methyltransferase [Nocardioides speluncae]